ncbi:ATP phosphoribosyltransferase [Dyadobacter sp. BE34]|uniref:ATP phosphoribosyltransferase n=1 Tax=Dyadobacter fermentans TaxID=94254 RepID=A0ABU1QYI2_9BACT|nr:MULTISPECIES: ATP phosphoribosyltransferase [Dyadobacter]MBZ1358301.1 ATP phosphoribosyltransferase [Dyadobacter fermentans]MDR6805719.1 ATP phosphoribosyltransferase [Dyadobacter fermentans]MDR7042521.1 ATP phosphoribosyltransferase [Dyadobacter sp. BE242]MDR7196833.1 ATP phosphoribosyltransferase [Dyadobacter sp. BE34]MDR7215732.1 ATP phosphoribosyltransferase [Dyadobacter sp. BE31]
MNDNILRIAIQKSGRLSEDSLKLIKECGIRFDNGAGKLKTDATNFPAEILFLRDDDIPGYVEDGVAHLGIVGENVSEESCKDVDTVHKLGFSKCRLSIGVLREAEYNGVQDLQGKSIATTYPRLLEQYLKSHDVTADIHEISGSVEIAPSIGLADAVCDIVSSGSTLLSNGLKEVETIFRSEAVMIASKHLSPVQQDLLDQLLFRIKSVQVAKNNKYILLNCPVDAVENITKFLPGMRSPTILPLATEGWCSLHSVINENEFWENIEKIRQAGAEGILVIPIEKMIV